MSSESPGPVTFRGRVLAGAADVTAAASFRAADPAIGAAPVPAFPAAGRPEVEAARALEAAFPRASERPPDTRAPCREAVADGRAELGAPLIARAMAGTGLPRARPEDGRVRAVGPLQPFADPARSAHGAGRVRANGRPAGVAVAPATVRGGPLPETSDGRSRAVGTPAIAPFLRPVRHRALPAGLLPPPLRPDNPWRRARRIDGVLAPQPGR
ncbi:hypothetical protein ACLBXO_18075 [Methylobacterium sp. C33D]